MPDHRRSDVIANRDEAIPVLLLPDLDSTVDGRERILGHGRSNSQSANGTTPEGNHGSAARDRLRSIHARASAKFHDKMETVGATDASPGKGQKMQDRLTNLLLQQIIPLQAEADQPVDAKTRKLTSDRPNFSLPQMSTNFRRFNARIGVAFVFQSKLMKLFSWRYPTQSLSFLAIYTFICIDPSMLTIVPLAGLLYFVMFPAFIARHPPPPSLPAENLYPLTGPPLAPAATVKPAPELSKDFFRNMRDLQNCMEDFSRLHDFTVATVGPLTNFSDEVVSSALFISLFLACLLLFLTAHLIPWRPVFLIAGWIMVVSGHPTIQALLEATTAENQEAIDNTDYSIRHKIVEFATADVTLDPSPEKREVEIFELQFRPLYFDAADEWTPVSFSPAPYTPLSPARIAGSRPKGTRFFEDVAAPQGWRWADKKWSLDLAAREWVEERMIGGVEVEVEGGRWVVDVVENVKGEDSDESPPRNTGLKGTYRHGEWRRRRWVRVVERVPFGIRDD